MNDNPFRTLPGAVQNSCYGQFTDGRLIVGEGEAPRMAEEVHAALRAVLHDPDFPCVGAKSIINQSSYRFGLYREMADEGATNGLAYDLARFVEERPSIQGEFSTFIASFVEPKLRTPKEFETMLWRQLEALHKVDSRFYTWCDSISSNPEDPKFGYSFAGQPFFVVGLSPASKRWARRFPWPTLVFNDHSQFERLREEQRFERIRDVIRERDERLHGTANEMLADFGTHSEARQYSGRSVGESWKCPVHFDTKKENDS